MNEQIAKENMMLAFIEEPSDDDDDDNCMMMICTYEDSFVGGKPIWLGHCPSAVPRCAKCERVQVLLLQLYAPLPGEHTYHRILYIFACINGPCKQYTVWRCQMSQHRFDAFKSGNDDSITSSSSSSSFSSSSPLCSVCGHLAKSLCGKCKSVHYCCREHQRAHWPVHRQHCNVTNEQNEQNLQNASSSSSIDEAPRLTLLLERELFEQKRLETEREVDAYEIASKVEGDQARELLNRAKVQLEKEGPLPLTEGDETEFATDRSKHIDKSFLEFQHRIDTVAPDQIVRYGSAPLSASNTPSLDTFSVPNCQHCNAPRRFEVQLLPQVLYFLGVDRLHTSPIDFQSLFVYTCSKSCHIDDNNDYYQEFLEQQ